MFSSIRIKDKEFQPALFCAPLAGLTHSAFRRLMADFGGYGALFTELLSGNHILREDPEESTYLKHRSLEGNVFYQILFTGSDNVQAIVDRIVPLNPVGIDVNCGCAGMEVRRAGGGVNLFENKTALQKVLSSLRKAFNGPVTVKTRIGREAPDWRQQFLDRLRILEDCGVDAVTVHPRFANQYRKRSPRHEVYDWIAENTALPLIANGDIHNRSFIEEHPDLFRRVSGLMIGRMAVVQPWLFAAWNQQDFKVDFIRTWTSFYEYVMEDFAPDKALMPLKMFGRYFAKNFVFSHHFSTLLNNASCPEDLNSRAVGFLSSSPATTAAPSLGGI